MTFVETTPTSVPSCQKKDCYGDEGGYFWFWYHLKGNTLG